MTSYLPETPATPKRQAVKVTGFTFVITSVANKIVDPVLKDWILSTSPLIGFVVNLAYNFLDKEISTWFVIRKLKNMITELQILRSAPNCPPNKKKEIEKDIADLEKAIKTRRLKDLNIKI